MGIAAGTVDRSENSQEPPAFLDSRATINREDPFGRHGHTLRIEGTPTGILPAGPPEPVPADNPLQRAVEAVV